MFDFQSDVINAKKFKAGTEINPVIYSNSTTPSVYFILESKLPQALQQNLINLIRSIDNSLTFSIIAALPFKPTDKEQSKDVINLFARNCIDFTKYIPAYSKVIPLGRALYSLIKSDDLNVEGFYDTIQWKTSFFCPQYSLQVFPCPALFSFLGKANFEGYFFSKQIDFAKKAIVAHTRIPKPNLIQVDDTDAFLYKWISYDGVTSFDLETKGLDPWNPKGKIICLTLAFDSEKNTAYYLPFDKINTSLLATFFVNKKLIGNNIKYDIKWLRVKAGLSKSCFHIYWDNMKSSQAINELQYNSLKSDAWLYTPYGGYDVELENYKFKYPKCKEDYSLIPQSVLFPYATMDALVSLDCYRKHQIEIDVLDAICHLDNGWSLRRALQDIAFPAIQMFTDIEIRGMVYDWEKLKVLSVELKEEIKRRNLELHQILDMPEGVNLDSGDQLGKFLEERGWENPGRSKKGIYLTNYDALLYWKKKGHTEVDKLLEYSEYVSAFDTFVGEETGPKGNPTGYFQYRKSDNKIHGDFAVMMADSGRGKSYNPNLQNIIKTSSVYLGIDKNGKPIPLSLRVRECFCVPDETYDISESDAKGLQLRIVASFSQDAIMKDIFLNRGGDMHSMTGRSIFCPDTSIEEFIKNKNEKPYKSWRKKAKTVNFGLIFLSTARAFAQNFLINEWSLEEAKDYVKEYKLGDRQKKYLSLLLKDMELNKDILDKDVFIKDQEDFSYYWAASDDIKTKFFATYKGITAWHERQTSFGKEHGYVQSPFGFIRRVPFLTHIGKDDDPARTKNYLNITANSPTQNVEVCYMMYNMVRVSRELEERNLKTYLIGNIHDSFIKYLAKDEHEIVHEIAIKYFHEPIPEIMEGIPYEIDLGYSDYVNGDVWGVTEHEF